MFIDEQQHIRTFLGNEKVPDLYKTGMTFDQAEDVARNDPCDRTASSHIFGN